MKKYCTRALIMLTVLMLLMSSTVFFVVAGDGEEIVDAVKITSSSMSVARKKTVQMKATVTAADGLAHTVTWTSSNPGVAKVDQSGLVTGVAVGRALITATVRDLGVSDSFMIYGTKSKNFALNLLEKKQLLGYRYSYEDNYFYTDDKDCWQDFFGFFRIYDLVAPYVLLEYDYIRVFFTYDNLDWMIQLWKGQYGLLFYGGEVGVYTKKMSDKEVTAFTQFQCPGKENWLDMGMSLYRDEAEDGNYVFQFERPYDNYWWCTGFKDGYLNDVEPADELRLSTRITMKDADMLEFFTKGLEECGFQSVDSLNALVHDRFFVDGLDVHIIWQDISEAENTVAIKTTIGVLASAGFIGFFLMLFMLFVAVFAMGGLGFLIFLI